MQRVVALFLEDGQRDVAIRDSSAVLIAMRLEYAAHRLKGSVANFFASDAVDAALRWKLSGTHATSPARQLALLYWRGDARIGAALIALLRECEPRPAQSTIASWLG